MQKPFSVREAKQIEELLALNKELAGMNKQLQQFENAKKELDKIDGDIKNKAITQILIPSLGGLYVKINPTSQKFKKMSKDKLREFDNSILGIKGQLAHRGDLANEIMIKVAFSLLNHLKEEGINLKRHPMSALFKEE